MKEVRDLKNSIEFTQSQVEELTKGNYDHKIKDLQVNIDNILEKTDDLENRSRRKNLCFEGIAEPYVRNEAWDQSEEQVKKIISEHMNLDAHGIKIERAHQVGTKKSSSDKPRNIIAKYF